MDIAEKALQLKQDIDEVYEAGNKNGYDEATLKLWEAMTGRGLKDVGERMFTGADFTNIEELPYPFVAKDTCYRMFYNYYGKKLPRPQYIDLSKLAPTANIQQIFSWWTSCAETGWIQNGVVPDYGLPAMNQYPYAFSSASAVFTIEIIRVHKSTTFDGTFDGCTALKNITFEGVIGRSISFSSCPLTVESMKSIITHLKDYSGDITNAGKYTLTLKDSCKTLMSEQGALDELDGKTYDQYITDIGWNLA